MCNHPRKQDIHFIFFQRGPSGVTLLLGVSGLMAYGFYVVGQTNQKKRCAASLHFHFAVVLNLFGFSRLQKEAMDARIALAPLLQAEEDRKCVLIATIFIPLKVTRCARSIRRSIQNLHAEALIMKDIPVCVLQLILDRDV